VAEAGTAKQVEVATVAMVVTVVMVAAREAKVERDFPVPAATGVRAVVVKHG
jgi:hypothetical protein